MAEWFGGSRVLKIERDETNWLSPVTFATVGAPIALNFDDDENLYVTTQGVGTEKYDINETRLPNPDTGAFPFASLSGCQAKLAQDDVLWVNGRPGGSVNRIELSGVLLSPLSTNLGSLFGIALWNELLDLPLR